MRAAVSEMEERLRAALRIELPYFDRPFQFESHEKSLARGTPAAVLVLFGANAQGEMNLLVAKRTHSVENHKGQMAFPGGVMDPGEDVVTAALREADEEVGIPASKVKILGYLPKLFTVTGFSVTPILGTLQVPLDSLELRLNPAEVDEAIWVPFQKLIDPSTYQSETRVYGGVEYPVHVYQVGPYRIWGATGAMIKNLLDRLLRL